MIFKQRLYLATQNLHKLQEFREIFAPLGYDIAGLEDVVGYEVIEDGSTFAENALKKAYALLDIVKDAAAIADDSGLMVDALDGAPGVWSARYSGIAGTQKDAANRAKLLNDLKDVGITQRTARFVCAIAMVIPNRPPIVVEGRCEGKIGFCEQGTNGFGYDSIFIPNGYDCTMAELIADEKNSISHRGKAIASLLQHEAFLKAS